MTQSEKPMASVIDPDTIDLARREVLTDDLRALSEELRKSETRMQTITERMETALTEKDAAEAKFADLRDQIARVQADLERQTQELQSELAKTRAAQTTAETALNDAKAEVTRLKSRADDADRLSQALTKLHNSKSWKVTAPLRALSKLTGGNRSA